MKEYPPDRYKTVQRATNFARNNLGIHEVDYGKELRIANTCNRAILSLRKRGVELPLGVTVDAGQFQAAEENLQLATYEPPLGDPDMPGRIVINPAHKVWQSDAEARKLRGQFSTGSRYHATVHEMAELAYHRAIGGEAFDSWSQHYQDEEEKFRKLIKGKEKNLANLVSRYAVQNHAELVCEVWTALMLGRDELLKSDLVMEVYRTVGGPEQFSNAN